MTPRAPASEPDAAPAPGSPGPSASLAWIAPLVVGALTALAYLNAIPNAFVMDDASFAPEPGSRVTFAGIMQLFREDAWAGARTPTGVYRPLALATIALERFLHGDGGAGFHVTNVVAHVLATLAVYAVLALLLCEDAERRGEPAASALPAACVAALIFGVHPIHTEAVDSIFNRSEILATAGVLGTLWLVLRFAEAHPWRVWPAAAVGYLASLLCKESAATLPVLAALLLLLRPKHDLRARLRQLLPLLALAIPLGVYWALRTAALPDFTTAATQAIGRGHTAGATTGVRLALVATSMREFVRMMFIPYPLRASYDDYAAAGVPSAVALHAALVAAAVGLRRRVPGVSAGIAFFYVALLPSTRLISHHGVVVTVAERYTYLPSVGFTLALGFVLGAAARRGGIAACLVPGALVVGVYGALTAARNVDWASEPRLWEAEVATAPQNPDGWKWLTAAYLNGDNVDAAVRICDQRLPGFPDAAALEINCGVAYERRGRLVAAERALERAVDTSATSTAHLSLARFYAHTGKRADSERQYGLAIEAERDDVRRHVTRGEMLAKLHMERLDEAEAEYARAVAIEPRFGPAQVGLRNVRRLRQAARGQ